jgi:hypothetical protein
MRTRSIALLCVALLVGGAACGSSASDGASGTTTTVERETTTTGDAVTTPDGVTTTTSGSAFSIVNVWASAPVDQTKLPIGTPHVSTEAPAVGDLFACDAGNANGGGAFAVGPWIDEEAGTWDATEKVSVQGEVSWPMAAYDEAVEGEIRTITSNGLPVGEVTGTFPIAADDPAYSYDRNPNSIAETAIEVTLPVSPEAAATPSCLGKGTIGVLRNGVALYAPIDERNRDAVAYETQDACDGHPQQASTYHYHDIPTCIRDASTGSSTVVGFAYDGYPIVVERDGDGELPTNDDLDECHGRTSPIELDGEITTIYHYSATSEFPYAVGCFHGTAS